MILEIAEIHIKEGTEADFESAMKESIEKYVSPTEGYIKYELQRGIEEPTRYMLMITWESVDAHMINFRESDVYAKHRDLIGPYFAKPAHVQHFELCS